VVVVCVVRVARKGEPSTQDVNDLQDSGLLDSETTALPDDLLEDTHYYVTQTNYMDDDKLNSDDHFDE
jgi:hypothetical protein